MIKRKASPRKSGQEAHPFLTTAIAIALIGLCLWASQWQFQRGIDRHHRNALIESNVSQPLMNIDLAIASANQSEWRTITDRGIFESQHQVLLRNKYFEGKYGFNLLTLFTDSSGRHFWVNRGWIAPGETAKSVPTTPETSTKEITIIGRFRLDSSLPQGSFFAIPSKSSRNLIEEWNVQDKNALSTEGFYVDLMQTSDPLSNPAVPVELPELSDGPHMAYALQWLFFGGLVFYGRILLRRSSEILPGVQI